MRAQNCSQEPLHSFWYLGKLRSVGTWQVRWNTFGHFSQHNRSPPFWHTAHQSSFGSSSLLLPSPPTLAALCIKLLTGDFPFTRLCPDCLQLSLKSAGSVFTWFSRLPNASNSLSRCKLVDSGGVKLLSGLLSWNESSTWKSESILHGHLSSYVASQKHSHHLEVLYSPPTIHGRSWRPESHTVLNTTCEQVHPFQEQTYFYWYNMINKLSDKSTNKQLKIYLHYH